MDCHYHLGRESSKSCTICGKPLCDECAIELAGNTYCKDCLEIIVGNTTQQKNVVEDQNISQTIEEMDSPYALNSYEEPEPVSFKSDIQTDNVVDDNFNMNKSKYSQYDVSSQIDDFDFSTPSNFNEPEFGSMGNNNPYDLSPEEYVPEPPANLYSGNSTIDDDFIYPDHTYQPSESQEYSTESDYDSYLNDFTFDEASLQEQLIKDEENFGPISQTPYNPPKREYVPSEPYYEPQGYNSPENMQQAGYLDIGNVTYNNPQGDYIPPKQQYSAYENRVYENPSNVRQYSGQNDPNIKPATRPIHSIRGEEEKEPVGALDIVLTIILIILIVVVLFYIVYVFLLSSYYPTFLDAVYGLGDPGVLFGHLMGN